LDVDTDADEEEIKQAYRRRAKETHPDQGGSAEQFLLVRTAYEEIKAGYREEITENGQGGVDSDRGRADEEPGAESEDAEQRSQETSRVEYLNYEVLDDHGWDIGDEDLFEKAAAADLDPADYGRILVQPDESLLEAAENRGFAWPYACRGGACANCAVGVVDGEMAMPVNNILPPGMIDSGIRLSCNGMVVTDEMQVIYNVKHLPGLEELRLPPRPFEQAHLDD
jgi:curved DNA-binding protein CbpA